MRRRRFPATCCYCLRFETQDKGSSCGEFLGPPRTKCKASSDSNYTPPPPPPAINLAPGTECAASGGFISFELITGYVLSAPAESMLMQPGTLQLSDCLNYCRQNSSCLSINFETGLCVLLQESADKNPQALQKSQFPVFTIYAHKICLQGKLDRYNLFGFDF